MGKPCVMFNPYTVGPCLGQGRLQRIVLLGGFGSSGPRPPCSAESDFTAAALSGLPVGAHARCQVSGGVTLAPESGQLHCFLMPRSLSHHISFRQERCTGRLLLLEGVTARGNAASCRKGRAFGKYCICAAPAAQWTETPLIEAAIQIKRITKNSWFEVLKNTHGRECRPSDDAFVMLPQSLLH